MNARVQKVVDEFLELSDEERELAIAELEASLGVEDPPELVEKSWAEEIQRRLREVREGRSRGRDGHEAIAEIRAELATMKR
jgi:hypothetical protein